MTFEIYQGEESYDSSRNQISSDTEKKVARIKNKQVGMKILDIFKM